MFDPREKLIAMNEARGLFPKPPHLATLYRWIKSGAHGVRLETVVVGRTRYTTAEAIQRFIAGQNGPPPIVLTASERKRLAAQAASILEMRGYRRAK